MRTTTRIGAALTVGVALLGGGLLAAPVASAATCHADTCSGLDPHDTGCDRDARTVDSVSSGNGIVALRWSETCQTNWATVHEVPTWGTTFWVENVQGDKRAFGWGWGGAASGWGDMVNGHDILARACITDTLGRADKCTPWW